MKRFEIFKPGRHTASSGATLNFTEDDILQAVANYDPAVHEAPIVVGHPKDNAPAYGWIGKLDYTDGAIGAEPAQVDPAFAEMVAAGRFKKRSASWYLPDSPNNPKPGALYLRHVGFLGAMPPAVKGLKDVAFAEGEEGVVEFTDGRVVASVMANIARRFREWLIAEKGVETADKTIPDFLVADLEAEARAPQTEPGEPAHFQEHETMLTKEQIEALQAENAALKAAAEKAGKDTANFAEREAGLKAREDAIAKREQDAAKAAVTARVDTLVKEGRVLPAQKASVVEFAMSLAEGEATINFGEGDKAEKVTQREAYLRQLAAQPKAVDYGEHAGGAAQGGTDELDSQQLADKAIAYRKKQADAGKEISFTEAVGAVVAGKAD